ncbi:LacI family DNA-binding transcriptional regulator [Embleya hyalina]|uniref:LacI family transcriptional regulator n=1 Tax=Embleya hyalina TaxID=516124 RepID=A0A401YQ54_9ACTN|nr:LacI family DNA-binding transcriptional regulator [Embleya hyalina]GCD96728.1 LacI family transcriptional regulator [Embleya hyalina]
MTPDRLSVRRIADRIGVSAATVSRVLNDKPGVAEHTRTRVLAAIREQGMVAPAPVGQPFVGIIVPELENPAFALLAGAVEARLSQYGVTALIGSSTKHGPTELDYIETLLRRGIEGLVLVSGRHANPEADHGFYWHLHGKHVAMVLVNGGVPGLPVSTVTTDEAAGAAMAVAHLHSLGHTRIALAGGEEFYRPSRHRLAGYRAAMTATFGGCDDALYVESTYSITGGQAAARRLLDAGATAIITGSDLMALGAISAARESGRHVPTDVSVVGYDDSYLAAHSDPPLSTIQQPIEQMSTAIATAMWQQLQGYHVPHVDHRFAPRLVARASTTAAPTGSNA